MLKITHRMLADMGQPLGRTHCDPDTVLLSVPAPARGVLTIISKARSLSPLFIKQGVGQRRSGKGQHQSQRIYSSLQQRLEK